MLFRQVMVPAPVGVDPKRELPRVKETAVKEVQPESMVWKEDYLQCLHYYIHSFIQIIYVEPVKNNYPEVLLAEPWWKRTVFKWWQKVSMQSIPKIRCRSSLWPFQVDCPATEKVVSVDCLLQGIRKIPALVNLWCFCNGNRTMAIMSILYWWEDEMTRERTCYSPSLCWGWINKVASTSWPWLPQG